MDQGTRLRRIELRDVRLFEHVTLEPDLEGATVLVGPNGSGKSTVLEAAAFLGTQKSFRTTVRDAIVRNGAERAIVRAELVRDGRQSVVESDLRQDRGPRTFVDRTRVQSRRALARLVPVTVFSPEDLALVQGGPRSRRDLLDDALGVLDPSAADAIDTLERVLRQRGALLRQAAGKLSAEISATLDVWDERLAAVGEKVTAARRGLVVELQPLVQEGYRALAGAGGSEGGTRAVQPGEAVLSVDMAYRASWSGDLNQALGASRTDDLRRGVSTVGPHRDEVDLSFVEEGKSRTARLHASQGEQRSLALALRLGVHRLVAERMRAAPILLLDDVFSELDPARSRALVERLPAGQTLLTTAAPLPTGITVATVVDVRTLVAPKGTKDVVQDAGETTGEPGKEPEGGPVGEPTGRNPEEPTGGPDQ